MRRGLIFCGVVDELVELLVTVVVVGDGVTADSLVRQSLLPVLC